MERELNLPYGSGSLSCTVTRGTFTGVYLPAKEEAGSSGESMVYEACAIQ